MTDFQSNSLNTIAPRISIGFLISISTDGEVLVWRKNDTGLFNIIICEEDHVAYSFIPYNHNEKRIFYIYDGNLEKLISDFENT